MESWECELSAVNWVCGQVESFCHRSEFCLLCHPLVSGDVAARGIRGAHFTQQSLPSNPPAPECDNVTAAKSPVIMQRTKLSSRNKERRMVCDWGGRQSRLWQGDEAKRHQQSCQDSMGRQTSQGVNKTPADG